MAACAIWLAWLAARRSAPQASAVRTRAYKLKVTRKIRARVAHVCVGIFGCLCTLPRDREELVLSQLHNRSRINIAHPKAPPSRLALGPCFVVWCARTAVAVELAKFNLPVVVAAWVGKYKHIQSIYSQHCYQTPVD